MLFARSGCAFLAMLFWLPPLAGSPAWAANIVADGGFERPLVPDGGYQDYSTGAKIGPWKVVGDAGNVAVINKNYVATGGYACPAKSGDQWIDLTATSFTQTGVEQRVTTTKGQNYAVKFYVGNISNPGGPLGTQSTVFVNIDGIKVFTATNKAGKDVKSVVWKKFELTFTAHREHTVIGFINGDPSTDDANGLDGVSVVATAGSH